MTESIIQELIDQEEDTQKGRFLTFTLGSECYGIEIQYVSEIIGIQPITEMPEHPEYVRGIINLRGKIIPVMDVRIRFKKQSIEYNDRTCIIVIIIDDVSIGLIVDSVAEVLTIPDHDIVSPPDISGVSNKYIQGIGKVGNEVKMLLNCDKLLNEQDVEYLATI
ncbi:chemotaxis protein CheW [Lacrimispora amygdalina]|uniref:Chemotaxis protein CheW n=1 Tax=Lacrimispora amygdalina TaxID=253257 RepID=A0A3E2NHT7_9FIRM|nr:chemotaxis protein CheW [Clostridium indicum]RFZ80567.1 chemotaxis protein CheW [Clostridium indicum]